MDTSQMDVLFNPKFPYTFGDFDSNVGHINSMIRDIFTEYIIETKLPYGNYYGQDTINAVRSLRAIFLLGNSPDVDEILFNRMSRERNAIEFKNSAR